MADNNNNLPVQESLNNHLIEIILFRYLQILAIIKHKCPSKIHNSYKVLCLAYCKKKLLICHYDKKTIPQKYLLARTHCLPLNMDIFLNAAIVILLTKILRLLWEASIPTVLQTCTTDYFYAV